jgi:hypothetical protein
MKDYKQVSDSVFRKAEERTAEKKRRHAIIWRSSLIASGMAAVLIAGIGIWKNDDIRDVLKRDRHSSDIIDIEDITTNTYTSVMTTTSKHTALSSAVSAASTSVSTVDTTAETAVQHHDTVTASKNTSSETASETRSITSSARTLPAVYSTTVTPANVTETMVSNVITTASSVPHSANTTKTSVTLRTTTTTVTKRTTTTTAVNWTKPVPQTTVIPTIEQIDTSSSLFVTTTDAQTVGPAVVASTMAVPSTTLEATTTEAVTTTEPVVPITLNVTVVEEGHFRAEGCPADREACISFKSIPYAVQFIDIKYDRDDTEHDISFRAGSDEYGFFGINVTNLSFSDHFDIYIRSDNEDYMVKPVEAYIES